MSLARRLFGLPVLWAAGAALLMGLFTQALHFQHRLDARLQAQLAARERLADALQEVEAAARFAHDDQPRLLALATSGVIGPPPRLRLLSALQALKPHPDVLALDWELGPPRLREPPPGAPAPDFEVHASTLTLRLSLPALASLPPLLTSLQVATGGASALRGCRLERRLDGKLDAQCELDWLSVTPPVAGETG